MGLFFCGLAVGIILTVCILYILLALVGFAGADELEQPFGDVAAVPASFHASEIARD